MHTVIPSHSYTDSAFRQLAEPPQNDYNTSSPIPEPMPMPENPPSYQMGSSFDIHVVAFATFFGLLSLFSCIHLIYYFCTPRTQKSLSAKKSSQRKSKCYARCYVNVRLLNLIACFILSLSRMIILIVDPYNIQQDQQNNVSPYISLIIFGIGFPAMNTLLLTMSLASRNVLVSIHKLKRLHGKDILYSSRQSLAIILAVQFLFQVVTDVLVATARSNSDSNGVSSTSTSTTASTTALTDLTFVWIIICDSAFLLYGVLLSIFVAAQIRDLIQESNADKRRKSGNLVGSSSTSMLRMARSLTIILFVHVSYIVTVTIWLIQFVQGLMAFPIYFVNIQTALRCLECLTIFIHLGLLTRTIRATHNSRKKTNLIQKKSVAKTNAYQKKESAQDTHNIELIVSKSCQ